jgi:WD40 repeat protein
MAVSSDGRQLATGSLDDSLVCLWDVEPLRKVAELPCISGTVYSLVFARDGRSLIAGYGNGRIRFWNIESGREVLVWNGHEAFVPGLALSPDGMTLASGSADGSVKLWPSKRYPLRDAEALR